MASTHPGSNLRPWRSESCADCPPFSVTATFGVVVMALGMKLDGLIEAADKALYSAKRAGRKRTAVTTARKLQSIPPVL